MPWTTKLALRMPLIQTILAGTSACATATAIYYKADPKVTRPLICATTLLTTSAIVEHYDAYQAQSRFHTKTAQSNNPEYLEKLKVIPHALDYKITQELAQGYGIAAAIMRRSQSDSHQKKAQFQPIIAQMSRNCNPRSMNMKAIFRR
jgi:hypothetical protein